MGHIWAQVNEVDEAMCKQTDGDDGYNNNNNNDNNIEHGTLMSTQELIGSWLSVPPVIASGSSLDSEKGKKIFGVSVLQLQQPPVMLGSLESLEAEDPTFQNFCARLETWINRMFPMYGCPFAPGLSCINLQADDKVSFASGPV